jgi:iron complex outermembrane receptor protein
MNQLIENYLTYNLDLGDHSFAALVGHSFQKIQYQWRTFSINRFPIVPTEPIYNPGIGKEITLATNRPAGNAFINELQSFYTRLNYDYQDKYLATATVRADGSSKFGSNNKYGIFPSFSLGWRISEEPFLKNSSISNLKLRGGWGQTGNQTVPLYSYFASLNSGSYTFGGAEAQVFSQTSLADRTITWETNNQTDIGIEGQMLNGRVNFSADYYKKRTNGILLALPLAAVTGFTSSTQNAGVIDNEGWEFALGYNSNPQGVPKQDLPENIL